jgi:hypothetical protein
MGRSGAAPLHGREKPKSTARNGCATDPLETREGSASLLRRARRRRTLQNRGHVADLKFGHYITNQPREAQFWNQAETFGARWSAGILLE